MRARVGRLHGFWSAAECAWLLSEVSVAAGLHGWHGARHRHYSTEDLPLWRAPRAARWVREQVRCRIFPAMAAVFGIPIDRLRLQECFAVRYEASGQASLAMHRDETLLSFNVSLSDGFEGGGTCFAQPTSLREWADGGSDLCALDSKLPSWTPGSEGSAVSVVRGERGDCLVHCGQLLHAGATVTRGTRIILIGCAQLARTRLVTRLGRLLHILCLMRPCRWWRALTTGSYSVDL